VKVFGAVFLGTARTAHAEQAHEAPPSMIGPMGVLVVCCCGIGLAPFAVAPVLQQAVAGWAPELRDARPPLAALAPLGWISVMGLLLLTTLFAGSALLVMRLRRSVVTAAGTWSCGYAALTPRMQYTASSFAQMVVGLFAWALRPRVHRPEVVELFPARTDFHSETPETVLDEALLPTFRWGAWTLSWLRVLQRGSVQRYLLYIFLTLVSL